MEDVGQHQTETARERFAELMDRRREELGLLWNDVAERAGLTKEGLRTLRAGTGKMRAPTKRGLETALGWKRGSIDRYLESDGDPAALEPVPIDVTVQGPAGRIVTRASAGSITTQEPPPDAGVDFIVHMPDGSAMSVQIKQHGHDSGHVSEMAQVIAHWANDQGGTAVIGGEGNFTIREIIDDPDLPDEVKRPLVKAYEALRVAAAAASRRRTTQTASEGPTVRIDKISKG